MKSGKPKIAIIMSCYNHERYVKEAVDSIIGQTYENWELYVADDGSTDGSGKILASYQDKRIHYFEFKQNTQFVGTMNFLQKQVYDSNADYIASLSSDDVWDTSKLQKQVDVLKKYKWYQACFTWDKVIFSTPDKGIYEGLENYSHKKNQDRFEWLYNFFLYGNCINACSVLIEKNLFFELGGMDQHFRQMSDFRMWYKLAAKYNFYMLEEELTYYRRHKTNLSEPSLEVIVRSINEHYQITKEIIMTMDKDVFRRTFYRDLPYMECNTEEELFAEKFMILVNNDVINQQAAMDIYFSNCNNSMFLSILEEKYYFSTKDFLELTGKYGIQSKWIPSQKYDISVNHSPAVIFINDLDAQKLNKETIERYRYSVLNSLWNITSRYEGGFDQFEKIKQCIICIQEDRKKCKQNPKVLFMIAENSQWDYSKTIQEKQDDGYYCYLSFIKTQKENLHLLNTELKVNLPVCETEVISLYNPKEHNLYFMHELSKEVDCIYYIDCLDHEYECGRMLTGYSLAVEYQCILKEEIYHNMMQNEKNILAMMKSIQTY